MADHDLTTMRRVARVFAGPGMFVAGLNHFIATRFYESIIPPLLPAPTALVYVSGVAEMIGALGTMFPKTRRPAGRFVIATLVIVFPANVYMAMNAERYPGVPGGRAALIARLPLQALFIYWVWLATQASDEPAEPPDLHTP